MKQRAPTEKQRATVNATNEVEARSSAPAAIDEPSPTAVADAVHVPPELTLNILEELYRTGIRSDFTTALRVCKEWNTLGTPLLWTYVAINNDSVFPFIHSLTDARCSTVQLVRNLSVCFNPIPCDPQQYSAFLTQLGYHSSDFPFQYVLRVRGDLYDRNDIDLQQYLRSMLALGQRSAGNICLTAASKLLASSIKAKLCGLTTFSFRVTPLPANLSQHRTHIYRGPRGAEKLLPLDLVASLLDALPPSCSQVELKIGNHEIKEFYEQRLASSKGTNYMCEALDRLLPRLTHLHLDAESISPFVFGSLIGGPMLPHLKSLCLDTGSMAITDRRYTQYASLGSQYALEDNDNDSGPARSTINSLRLQNLIARELRSAYRSGRFPSIEHLHLLEVQQDGIHVPYYEYRYNTIDVLEECIEVIPTTSIIVVPDLPNGNEDSGFGNNETWMIVLGRDGQLIFMDENQHDSCAAPSWALSTTGIRVPAAVKFTREIKKFGFEWVDPSKQGMSRKEFLEKAKTEHGEEMAESADYETKHLANNIRRPYVIKGLLEWYG